MSNTIEASYKKKDERSNNYATIYGSCLTNKLDYVSLCEMEKSLKHIVSEKDADLDKFVKQFNLDRKKEDGIDINKYLNFIDHVPSKKNDFNNYLELLYEDESKLDDMQTYGFNPLNMPDEVVDADIKDCSYKSDYQY